MYYFNKLRDFPKRVRAIEYEKVHVDNGSFIYFHPTQYPKGKLMTGHGIVEKVSKVIYDDEPTGRDNNCVHWTRSHTLPIYNGTVRCLHTDYYTYYGSTIAGASSITPSMANNGLAPYPVDLMLNEDSVQDALANLWIKQHKKLYRLTSRELPDMTVFMVELRELSQVFSIVRGMLMHGVTLRKSIIKLQRRLKRLKRLKMTVVIKRYIRDTIKAIQTTSAELVKLRFGVQAPLRDLVRITTSFSIYLDEISSYSEKQTIRSTEEFEFEAWWGEDVFSGCWSQKCTQLYKDPLKCTHSKIKGKVVISQVVKNNLRGTAIEKTAFAVLGQVNLLPSVDTLWELTRLSWFVDYFYRTDILLGKLERLLGLGPKDVIVEKTSVSFSFQEEQRLFNQCWRVGQGRGPSLVTQHDYYERLVSDGDYLPFTDVVSYWRLPEGQQITTAVAYLLMKTLIGFRFKC